MGLMLIDRVADPVFKIWSDPDLRLMLIDRVADPYPDPFVKI